jgi:hypothetical protein
MVSEGEQPLAADQAQVACHGANGSQTQAAHRQPRNIREWRAAKAAIGGENAVEKRRGCAAHERYGRSFCCRRKTANSAVATAEDRPPHPQKSRCLRMSISSEMLRLEQAGPAMLPFAASTFRPQGRRFYV